MRIDRILFPTDFSECADQALRHALYLARQYGAELHMLNAVVLHSDDVAGAGRDFPSGGELLEGLLEVSGQRLTGQIDAEQRVALKIVEKQIRGYAAASLILEYARDQEIDLIVMGTHGRRAPARYFMGSVATEVVRRSECPVMTLRRGDPSREVESLRHILVPIDFSEHSFAALAHANDLARRYDASLQLLHVVELTTYPTLYGPAVPTFDVNRIKGATLSGMDQAMETLQRPTALYDRHVTCGRPATEIATFAREHEADLVVISSHGLSGLERLLTGSTTEQVVRQVDCPVLVVKVYGRSLIETPVSAAAASA